MRWPHCSRHSRDSFLDRARPPTPAQPVGLPVVAKRGGWRQRQPRSPPPWAHCSRRATSRSRRGSNRRGSNRHGSNRRGSNRHGSNRHGSNRRASNRHASNRASNHGRRRPTEERNPGTTYPLCTHFPLVCFSMQTPNGGQSRMLAGCCRTSISACPRPPSRQSLHEATKNLTMRRTLRKSGSVDPRAFQVG